MAAIIPTVTRFPWGQHSFQVLNYFAHPIRDRIGGPSDMTGTPIGNPWIAFRHSGGGTVGNLDECFDGAQAYSSFLDFLASRDRDTHFDLITIETGQRGIVDATAGATGIRPGIKMFMGDAIRDAQRCISSIKSFGARGFNGVATQKIDPDKGFTFGVSFGGSLMPLVQLYSKSFNSAPQRSMLYAGRKASSYDCSVNGVISLEGQIDSRQGYMAGTIFGGWYGTNLATTTEFDNLPDVEKEAFSIRALIQNGFTEGYAPFFLLNAEAGAHTYPLSDAHDSQQHFDLRQDLISAALPYGARYWNTGSHALPADCPNQLYQWMKGLLAARKRTGGPVG